MTEDEDVSIVTDEEGDMVADLNNLPDSFSAVTGGQLSIINEKNRVSSMVRINKTKPLLDKP